ncbi:MAG: winged helix DNA-binding protein [Candidatus Borkfalkiaceae bacterium]|nr:winged helix DNA-binding protein [Christensenellaceae bacterium]
MFKEIAGSLAFFLKKSSKELFNIVKSGHGESGVLQILLENEKNKKPLSSGDICAKMQLSSGRTALTLKSLGLKRLIVRRADEKDKRRTLVKLTEKGKVLAESTAKEVSAAVNKIVEKLGEKQAAEFIGMLATISE